MSLICATSNFTATLGITFLPKVVAGANICEYFSAKDNITGSIFSAIAFSNFSESIKMTFDTC